MTEVLQAIGVTVADLFVDRQRSTITWLRDFRYADADGAILYRVRRGELRGKRQWRVEHPTDQGWVSGYASDRVLYRLPEFVNAPDLPVWFCEGERDADSIARLGLIATTVAHSSWRSVDVAPLRGREVIVVVDHDQAGWRRGKEAVRQIEAAGGTVLRVARPADGYKDVTGHVAAGLSLDLLWPVDLEHDVPPEPAQVREATRAALRPNGLSFFVRSPISVMLGLVQAHKLLIEDVGVFELFEHRAGATEVAKLTRQDVAELCGMNRKQSAKSIDRLIACGLLTEAKRGEWHVSNPALRQTGSIPTDLAYADRVRPLRIPSSTNPPLRTQGVSPQSTLGSAKRAIRDASSVLPEHVEDPIDMVRLMFDGAEVVSSPRMEPEMP